MKSIDYVFKAKVLNNHSKLIKQVKQCSRYEYLLSLSELGVHTPSLSYYENKQTPRMLDLRNECVSLGMLDVYKECIKINHANYNREKRLTKRVHEILIKGQCIFITLTFNNDTLSNTDAKQRRVLVSRFLKASGGLYVANIDYGGLNNREHYHALISSSGIDYNAWHKYGAIKGEKVRNRNIECDNKRLAKYICKLSNHAIKETTKRSALIYSR